MCIGSGKLKVFVSKLMMCTYMWNVDLKSLYLYTYPCSIVPNSKECLNNIFLKEN